MTDKRLLTAEAIPRHIKEAGFPDIERVVVLGGSVLALHSLRPAHDIDIVTPIANTNALIASDPARWHKQVHHFRSIADHRPFQRTSVHDSNDLFDIWSQWYDARRPLGDRQVYTDELIERSWQHTLGFYVMRLEEMIDMKRAAGRDKDLNDVALYQKRIDT